MTIRVFEAWDLNMDAKGRGRFVFVVLRASQVYETPPPMAFPAYVAASKGSAHFVDYSKLRAIHDLDWFLRTTV